MNDDSTNPTDGAGEQWAAFQRIWTETFSKLMQMGISQQESAPPEFTRMFRAGIFQALSQSWDQFLRSPQFLESMKQWMENAVKFRQMSHEFLTRAHHEGGAPARDDVDQLFRAMAQVETRLLSRLDEVGGQVAALNERLSRLECAKAPAPAGRRSPKRSGA